MIHLYLGCRVTLDTKDAYFREMLMLKDKRKRKNYEVAWDLKEEQESSE